MPVTTGVVDEVLAANQAYAGEFDKGHLPMPPGRQFAVVTCMDACIETGGALGLEEGDAHVIRNAGGLVSDDALRLLVISHTLLGTQEAIVIGHSDCGMLTFTNDVIHSKIDEGCGGDASEIDFRPFPDVDEAVRASVKRVEESPLLPGSFGATGFVYEVGTGTLREVT
jgi:carbonic anhydrase